MAVLCLNEFRYHLILWWYGKDIIVIFEPHIRYKIPRETLSAGDKYTGSIKFAIIAIYLGNGTK